MPILPYLRPDLDQGENAPPLYITGTLPPAATRQAYEGRLQIHNQIGACSVISVTGDELPPGHQVYVDGDEIVVAWPAQSEGPSSVLVNPDFETGDISGWTVTTRGELPGYPVQATASSARPYQGSYSAFWKGNEGNGHARGVEAVWLNDARATVYPTQRVNASARIALDDTDTSQNRGRVLLVFFDEGGQEVRRYEGTLIRGNDSSYRLSEVGAYAPVGSAQVAVGVWTTANESPNSGVRFDAVQWDVPQDVGTGADTTMCITIQIRDSAGRTASWSGCILITGTRMAYAAAFSGASDAGKFWKILPDYTVAGPFPLPFNGNPSLFKVAGDRLYAGSQAHGVWYSEDQGDTWTQCTGILPGFPPGDIVKATNAYVLFYLSAGGGNNQVSRSTDGENFSTVTANMFYGAVDSVRIAGHGSALGINGTSNFNIGYSLDSGATWPPGQVVNAGFGFDPWMLGTSHGFYAFRDHSPYAVYFRSTFGSDWPTINVGMTMQGVSVGVDLEDGRIAIVGLGNWGGNANVSIGSPGDGWTTAAFPQFTDGLAPRANIAFNLDRVLVGEGRHVRTISLDLQSDQATPDFLAIGSFAIVTS